MDNDSNRTEKTGKLIIFSMENFENIQNLPGEKDVTVLKETFEMYNADVSEVYTDLTRDQLLSKIQKIKGADLQKYKYFVVAILTHGDRNNLLSTNNGSINLDTDVILPILRNLYLKDKPKLFIVDACKGRFDFLSANTDAVGFISAIPVPGNTLRCYATTEGFQAYGTEENGSIFTAEFCQLLKEHGNQTSVENIMKSTIRNVIQKTNNRQVPSYESNMIEDFILGNYV